MLEVDKVKMKERKNLRKMKNGKIKKGCAVLVEPCVCFFSSYFFFFEFIIQQELNFDGTVSHLERIT